MEVGQIDFPDIWCDKKGKTLQAKRTIPHSILFSDRRVSPILGEGLLIGHGRFAKVYRVLDKKTLAEVAVKTMKRNISGNPTATRVIRKVIEREITTLRVFSNHPNIIKLLKTIETPETVHLILELCEKSLFDILQLQGTLQESESRRVVRGVSEALVYLHANEFAHRDLKLTNVLCNSNPVNPKDFFHSIKLCDFGLSGCRGSPGTTKLFTCKCGTLTFMAPEVLMKDPYDVKCDVWSLGVILYFCLIGEEPLPGTTEEDVKQRICDLEVLLEGELWNNFSSGVQFLLKRMLDVDPITRSSALRVQRDDWTQGKDIGHLPVSRQRKGRRLQSSQDVVEKIKKCLDELNESKSSEKS